MKNSRIFDMLLGLAFVVIGIMAVNRPATTLGFLVFFFGVLAIVRGITAIVGLGAMTGQSSRGFQLILMDGSKLSPFLIGKLVWLAK